MERSEGRKEEATFRRRSEYRVKGRKDDRWVLI